GAAGLDRLVELVEAIELDRAQQIGVGLVDQRVDVCDLLLGEIVEQLVLALALGDAARRRIAVICERHGCRQDREDQGIHEQQTPHGPRILPFPSSLVSTEGCQPVGSVLEGKLLDGAHPEIWMISTSKYLEAKMDSIFEEDADAVGGEIE